MNIIWTQTFSNFGTAENRSTFMKEGNLNFDDFLTRVGMPSKVPFSNQTECNVIYQL